MKFGIIDTTKDPYDKISHLLIEVVLIAIAVLITINFGWWWTIAYGGTTRWYFREQSQEWHVTHRSNDAYLIWKWRWDSIKDWLVPSSIGLWFALTVEFKYRDWAISILN